MTDDSKYISELIRDSRSWGGGGTSLAVNVQTLASLSTVKLLLAGCSAPLVLALVSGRWGGA